MKQSKPISFDEPTITPGDPWLEVGYFNVVGSTAGSTRMSLSDLIEWLENNPGYLIHTLRDIS